MRSTESFLDEFLGKVQRIAQRTKLPQSPPCVAADKTQRNSIILERRASPYSSYPSDNMSLLKVYQDDGQSADTQSTM